VGLGASLADPRLAAAGDVSEIKRRARAFVALVAGAEVAPRAGA
jgi:2-keto-3-deoxy-6-phosphogluconate aldolase